MKFYHADNSNRLIKSNGQSFTFDPVSYIGGSWQGVFATSNPKQIEALDALVSDEKSAVKEISAEVYSNYCEKKANLPEAFRRSNNVSLSEAQSVAALVADGIAPEPQVEKPIESISIGEVVAPQRPSKKGKATAAATTAPAE